MSKTTPNHGFIKPELSDVADITMMNENWDKLDAEITPISYGTDDLVAGETELKTGKLYFVYE